MGLYLGAQNLLEGVGSVDGTGTPNYLTKWTDADTIEDSIVSDNGAIATVSGALVVTGTIDTPIISAVSLATDANGVIIEGTTGFGVSGTATFLPVFDATADGVGDSSFSQAIVDSVPALRVGAVDLGFETSSVGAGTLVGTDNISTIVSGGQILLNNNGSLIGLLTVGTQYFITHNANPSQSGIYQLGGAFGSTHQRLIYVSGDTPLAGGFGNGNVTASLVAISENTIQVGTTTEPTKLIVTGTIDTPIISAASLATNSDGVIIAGTTGVSGTAGTIPVFEAGGDGVGDSLVAQVSTSVPSTPGAITNTNTSILFTNSSGAGNLPAGRAGWITSSFSNYASGFDYSSTAAGFGASVVGFSIEFADAAAAIAFLGVASLANAGAFAAFATTVTVTQNDNATAQFAATHYARQAAVSGGVIIHFTQALNSTTAITPISGSGTQANVSSTNTIGGATIPAVPGDAIVTVTGDLTVTQKTTLATTLDGLVLATAGVLSTDSPITVTAGGAGVSATLSEYSTSNVSASASGVVDGLGNLDGIATLGFNASSATGFTNGQIFTSLTLDYVGTVQGLGSATFTGRWIYLDALGTGPDGTSTQISEAILYQALGNGVTALLDDGGTISFGPDQGLLTGTDFNSITAGQSGGTTITGDLTVTGATTLSGTTTLKIDDTGTGPAQNLQFRIADTGNTGATGFITFVRE